jgi:1-acyl-sn-glycerol-3-phosphate acyltransferase
MTRLLYLYRTATKLLFFAVFGIGSALLAITPLVRSRKFVSRSFRWFLSLLHFFGIVHIKIHHKERLQNLRSCVVVANHPSLLDVVILIALIPNADCLVKASLGKRHILQGVVGRLYVPNSLDFDEIVKRAKASLDAGRNFIVFPEGTRTVPGQPPDFKKGAARIALASQKTVQPIHIGGNEKIGLRKHDPLWSFHESEPYRYELDVLEKLDLAPYLALPSPKAAAQLTEAMEKILT